MYLKEMDANLVVVLDALLVDSSVTKAAERLGRSPSAVSHALHNLREIFNDELFVRAGQRLVPTPKATAIAPTVHIVVSGIESLIRPESPFDPSTIERTFVVCCGEAQELGLMRRVREHIMTAAPGIEIDVRRHDSEEGLEQLRHGESQLIISDIQEEETNGEVVQAPLHFERYVTLGRAGHPFAATKPTKKQFASAKHIIPLEAVGSADYMAILQQLSRTQEPDLEFARGAFGALTAALQSDALIGVPASLAKVAGMHMGVSEIEQPFKPLDVQLFMSWHRAMDRDECHAWLRAQFVEVATQNGR